MDELKKPPVLQLRHNNSDGFVYAYEVDEMNKYLSEVDNVLAEKDAEIATLKKEVSRQKRLRCYNLKMWCSAERFTNRGRTIPDEGRWWERHFYSVCRIWERFKEADK